MGNYAISDAAALTFRYSEEEIGQGQTTYEEKLLSLLVMSLMIIFLG